MVKKEFLVNLNKIDDLKDFVNEMTLKIATLTHA